MEVTVEIQDITCALPEESGGESLIFIACSFLGFIMDFHNKAVGSCGYSGQGHGGDKGGPPGAVRGVDYHREVRDLFQGGVSAEIQSIPGIRLKGPDTALTKDDMGVPFRQDIFSAGKPLL